MVVRIEITSISTRLGPDQVMSLSATPRDGSGAAMSGITVTWSSSNASVVQVGSSTGVATAVAQGTAVVRAQAGNVVGEVTLVVVGDLDFLGSPFAGSFPLNEFFDHQFPIPAQADGTALTFQGQEVAGKGGSDSYIWLVPQGTPVRAAAAGRVVSSGSTAPFNCPGVGMVADRVVVLEHTAETGQTYRTTYGHLDQPLVSAGQNVTSGQSIGASGMSGCTTAPSFRFAVHRMDSRGPTALDPYGWSGAGTDPWATHQSGGTSIDLWRAGQAPTLIQ